MSSLPEMPFSGSALNSSTNIIFFIDIGPLWGLFRGVVEEKQREAAAQATLVACSVVTVRSLHLRSDV